MNSLAKHIDAEEPDIATIAISPGRCDTDMQGELRSRGKDVMNTADYEKFIREQYVKEKAMVEKLGLAMKS